MSTPNCRAPIRTEDTHQTAKDLPGPPKGSTWAPGLSRVLLGVVFGLGWQSRASDPTANAYLCLYIYTYVHVYVYICIYIEVYFFRY